MRTPWFRRQRAIVGATRDGISYSKSALDDLLVWEITAGDDDVRKDDVRDLEEPRLDAVAQVREEEDNVEPIPSTTTIFLDSWIPEVIGDKETGMVAMFNELWHEMEEGPVRMVATDQDNGMVAMFRQAGSSAVEEFEAGRRVLTQATLQQIKWTLQQAMELLKNTPLLMMMATQDQQQHNRNIFLTDTMFEI